MFRQIYTGPREWLKARRRGEAEELQRTPEETRYVRKLDACLLAFCCLSQVIKYLDQQNINFAYTAGMKEDLHLYGRELNYFLTYFQVGYCIFLVPSLLLLTRFRPALYLSALEFIWGCLTLGLAGAQNAKTIYALRAFIGATESSAYPGAIGILMSWYTPWEMAKRVGFYHSSQAVGAMLAGALQAAIYKSLNGKHGLAGWRWNFIINGVITLAIAICGVFMIPDFPQKPSSLAIWFRPKDREIAARRLQVWRRKAPNAINIRTFKQIVKSPIVYHLAAIYAATLLACQGTQYLNLFLKSLKHPDGTKVWSTEELSVIPIGGYAIRLAGTWILAIASDMLRTRWPILLFLCLFGIPPTVILTVWVVPTSAKYYAYFALFFADSSGPLIWAWLSDMLPTEAEQRTLIVGVCGTTYYAISAWSNPLIYPANQAPRYTNGWAVCLALWVFSILVIISMRIWDEKYVQPIRQRLQREEAFAVQAAQDEDIAHDQEPLGKDDTDKAATVNIETSPVELRR